SPLHNGTYIWQRWYRLPARTRPRMTAARLHPAVEAMLTAAHDCRGIDSTDAIERVAGGCVRPSDVEGAGTDPERAGSMRAPVSTLVLILTFAAGAFAQGEPTPSGSTAPADAGRSEALLPEPNSLTSAMDYIDRRWGTRPAKPGFYPDFSSPV